MQMAAFWSDPPCKPSVFIDTVKAPNVGPHGNFGPLFQKGLLSLKRILQKNEENKSCRNTLDLQICFCSYLVPSRPLILDLMETLDLFFRRACYRWNASYRKMKRIKVVEKLYIYYLDLFIFCTRFIHRSYRACKKSPEFPWGPKLEVFTVHDSSKEATELAKEVQSFDEVQSYGLLR